MKFQFLLKIRNSLYKFFWVIFFTFIMFRSIYFLALNFLRENITDMYNILCSCSREYKGKTSCFFQIKFDEYKKGVISEMMADHE